MRGRGGELEGRQRAECALPQAGAPVSRLGAAGNVRAEEELQEGSTAVRRRGHSRDSNAQFVQPSMPGWCSLKKGALYKYCLDEAGN